MKRIFLTVLFSLFLVHAWTQPLPEKKYHNVIIDTDCGIDDFRALCIILSRPEIAVKGIIASEGSLTADEGLLKIKSLLNETSRNDIPISRGRSLKGVNPSWRSFNRDVSWGSSSGSAETVNTGDLFRINGNERFTLVSLGAMTNIADALQKDPSLVRQVDRIIWYNGSVDPLKGFNYECDRESADRVFRSGIRIDVISNLELQDSFFDASLYSISKESDTNLARLLKLVFSQEKPLERLNQNHYRLNDDLVAFYLTNPELFGMNINPSRLNVRYNREYDVSSVREVYKDMIRGNYFSEQNIVFSRFPVQQEMFEYDIRPIVDTAIARYGMDEWKANVMTDEFHGHLGVFSIVGAKMGIKARELFGVGPDQLVVTTYAGTRPPYSCLNDGIQVSTGATLGMGTIHLANDTVYRPSAIFRYKERAVRITLKKEYLSKVDADINEGIVKYGLMDDGYWKLIRRNAIKYWLEWDRDVIFEINEISIP